MYFRVPSVAPIFCRCHSLLPQNTGGAGAAQSTRSCLILPQALRLTAMSQGAPASPSTALPGRLSCEWHRCVSALEHPSLSSDLLPQHGAVIVPASLPAEYNPRDILPRFSHTPGTTRQTVSCWHVPCTKPPWHTPKRDAPPQPSLSSAPLTTRVQPTTSHIALPATILLHPLPSSSTQQN
jgi:hypothetical protein